MTGSTITSSRSQADDPNDSYNATTTTPLLQPLSSNSNNDTASTLSPASSVRSLSPSSLTKRKCRAAAIARNVSFATAILSALCAGTLTAYALYGHIFQERLHYSQYQVNGVAIVASFSMYLTVPILGYVCDRVGPAPLSLFSAFSFGGGYLLAAILFKNNATAPMGFEIPGARLAAPGSSYALMIVAFILIGIGSCAMYIGSVATCAKNFGKGKHRGLALAMPIAGVGLSGMWQSQMGSRVFYERLPDGSKGDVDVFHYFLFMAILLFVVGIIGTFTLRVIDEQDLIDEAVDELERSGMLDGSALFTPGRMTPGGYGTLERSDPMLDMEHALILDPAKDLEDDAKFKKTWLLNGETRRFLGDHTMWVLAAGFFLMIGPGEAFINNMGTIIKTLYPPTNEYTGVPTSAATHVSIICTVSTIIRLLVGALTDILAPSPTTQHVQIPSNAPMLQRMRFAVSRVTFLIFFALLMSLGMIILASGAIQNHGDRFWIVSSLIGAGYGAIFSITPIIVTIIWGVENFGTNWGITIMFPCVGVMLWGFVYSAVYSAGASNSPNPPEGGQGDLFCYGTQCYAPAFWAMSGSVWVACLMVLWAWKGKNGWAQRGIVI